MAPKFVQDPSNGSPQTFTSADTTSKKSIYTAGAGGARIDSIRICTDDTSAVNLACYVSVGGTDYYVGNVNVPIGSGYTTVAPVDAIAYLAPLTGCLILEPSAILKMNCVATMTSAKVTTVTPTAAGEY